MVVGSPEEGEIKEYWETKEPSDVVLSSCSAAQNVAHARIGFSDLLPPA